jgi:hypothetical protein
MNMAERSNASFWLPTKHPMPESLAAPCGAP